MNETGRRGNLVLSRKIGERVLIHTSDGVIDLTIKSIGTVRVDLVFASPKRVEIRRAPPSEFQMDEDSV